VTLRFKWVQPVLDEFGEKEGERLFAEFGIRAFDALELKRSCRLHASAPKEVERMLMESGLAEFAETMRRPAKVLPDHVWLDGVDYGSKAKETEDHS
jgi:hypothetical protein